MLSRTAVQSALRASCRRSTAMPMANPASRIRSYAQAASPSSETTKPPVAVYGVDGTYASALYTAAAKNSALDPTFKALSALNEVLKRDTKLPVIIAAPTLTTDDKSQIIAELQKHTAGHDKDAIVTNFLKTLADNNRLGILEGICDKFAVLMGAARGEVEMVITSAQKLENKTLQRLETAVSKSEYSQGKKLKVVTKVNPDLLGGLVVEIGDRTIDMSVAAKVSKMNKLLTDQL